MASPTRKPLSTGPHKAPAKLSVEDETKPPTPPGKSESPSGAKKTSFTVSKPSRYKDISPFFVEEPSRIVFRRTSRRIETLEAGKDNTNSSSPTMHRDVESDLNKAVAGNSQQRQYHDQPYDAHIPLRKWHGEQKTSQKSEGLGSPYNAHRTPSNASDSVVHAGQGPRKSTWSITYAVESGLYSRPISHRPSLEEYIFEEEEEEEEEEHKKGIMDSLQYGLRRFCFQHQHIMKVIAAGIFFIAFVIYFGFALFLRVKERKKKQLYYYDYCNGVGFMIVITAFVVILVLYYHILCPIYTRWVKRHCTVYLKDVKDCIEDKTVKKILYGMTTLLFIVFLLLDGLEHESKLRCTAGVLIYVLIGYIFSKHPSHVQWSVVFWGLVMQYVFAIVLLYGGFGDLVIKCLSNKVKEFVDVSYDGADLIFSYMVNNKNQTVNVTSPLNCSHLHQLSCFINSTNTSSIRDDYTLLRGTGVMYIPFVIGFRMIPAILFFSCVLSVLFYYGLLQWFVVKIAFFLQIALGTTAAESINSAANIFLGCTEAPLIIRPFLANMTQSELHAVMTAGFATIAGTMFTVYVAFGLDPMDLMSATLMSAPAALAYAKLLYPETEQSVTTVKDIKLHKGLHAETNVFAAATNGTNNAIPLVATVIANLITFISLLKLLNLIVAWLTSLVGFPDVTLEWMMGKLFIPCAYFMGIGVDHCSLVGELIGIKTAISEFVAYERLDFYYNQGMLTHREKTISTYALCGFSNVSAIGIQLGTLGALAPNRMDDMAAVALRALIAGSVTSFLTACIAGSLLKEN